MSIFAVKGGLDFAESNIPVNIPLIQLGQPLLHGGVPVILDGVIGPALQVFGDLGPAVADVTVGKEE